MKARKRTAKRRKTLAGSGGNYEVGWGKPPKVGQFKPGQSGNPKGRPKGAKNAAMKAKDALRRKIVVTINGTRRKMSVEEVGFYRLGEKAIAGDQKALNYLLTLADNIEPALIEEARDSISREHDRAIIAGYLRRFKRGHRDEER